jgi:DNA-binding response OmpR family regulator
MNQILVVEADPQALTLRADELLADGHEVNTANSAAAARVKLPTATRVILGHLDHAPETLALLRDLRNGQIPHADPAIPVITIGADHDHEQVRHYQAGADISLPTTASPTLINAAIGALAARAARRASPRPSLLVGDLRIDRSARTATVAGELVQFTNREFELLSALAERPNEAIPIRELHRRVWGLAELRGRTSDTHLSRIREKLRGAGSTVEIQGVRGFGPRLSPGQPQRADQAPASAPRAPNPSPGRGRAR